MQTIGSKCTDTVKASRVNGAWKLSVEDFIILVDISKICGYATYVAHYSDSCIKDLWAENAQGFNTMVTALFMDTK